VRAASGSQGRPRRASGPPPEGQQALGVPVHGDVDPQTLALEREALRIAVQRPALAGPGFDEIEPDAFLSPAYRTLRETITKAGGCATQAGGAEWVEALAGAAADDVSRTLISELSAEPVPSGDSTMERYAESVILRLHEVWVSRQVVTLKATLQRTDPAAETATYNRLFGELMALEKHRRDLRERGLGGD
jgi:DNA primase